MPLRLRDHLHWCECAGRIVFLDVAKDRYFCLPASANAAFLALAACRAGLADERRLNMLIDQGFLVRTAFLDAFQQPPAIETPAHDFAADPMPRSAVVPLMGALWSECRAALQLRFGSLSEVIARAGRPIRTPPALSSESDRVIRSIAAAAGAIAFVTRSHDRCLVRALAVHASCRARGVRAKLVVGVIGHPFAAHSWVQLGDAVVVGDFEQARLYTPIMVIE